MTKLILLFAIFTSCGFAFSQSGKIFTTSQRVIECSSIQNKRFGVEYISVNSTDNTRDYIPHSKIDRIEYDNGTIEYISGSPNKDQKKRNKKDPKDFSYLSPNYVSINVGPAIAFPGLNFGSDYMGFGAGQTGIGVQVFVDAVYSPDIFVGFGFAAFTGYSYNSFEFTLLNTILQNQFPANANNVNFKTQGWNNIYFM